MKTLIQTTGLDQSFFYQLALAAGLYFILKKTLFQPYLKKMAERHKLTQGRLKSNKDLELKISELKIAYAKKAKKIHKEFQELFNKTKEKAERDFARESLLLKEARKKEARKERQSLSQAIKASAALLEKDLPGLAELLAKRI